MAETMLLLLFCLMLASAAVLLRKEMAIRELSTAAVTTGVKLDLALPVALATKLASLKLTAAEAAVLVEILNDREAQASPEKPSEFWKELKEANDIARVMRDKEVSLQQIEQALDKVVQATPQLRADKKHDWPPIIRLSDADGYSFDVGSAHLSAKFESDLQASVADEVARIIREYDVDVVEVIGHTDEQRVWLTGPNFDDKALPTLRGEENIATLVPGDNASLGLARAISVTNVLRADPRLRGVRILPLSGGQLIMPGDLISDGSQSGDVAQRRRIEIRLRRHTDVGN
jgi:outer membrane protein OmpA-like peptidoglycan-associated protein